MIHLKSFLIIFCLIGLSGFFSSCDNDLELIGPKVEVPIIYGAISISDPFVFIRLERAFGDNNISPLELSKNPDSLYYNDAVVTISLPSKNFSVELERVDATTLGFPRDTGVFANTPNYIYKVDKDQFIFEPGGKYNLSIKVKGKEYTSSTLLINLIEIVQPKISQPLLWNPKVDEVITQSPLFWFQNKEGSQEEASPAIVSLFVRFNYNERDQAVSQEYIPKSLLISVAESVIPDGNRFRYSINKIYAKIGESLAKSATIDRYSTSVDFVVVTGGKEFLDYNEALAANSGITGTQDFPIFTNISGGFGIFSSKNTQNFPGYYLSELSLDSLAVGRFTKELNFRK